MNGYVKFERTEPRHFSDLTWERLLESLPWWTGRFGDVAWIVRDDASQEA